jgi:Uri superfamily endonuclease
MQKSGRGVYILTMQMVHDMALTVGNLGTFEFPAGYYLYVGSAMSGFAGRINRHLRRRKKMRWHIDYLLEAADLLWVDLYETDSPDAECKLNGEVAELEGAVSIVPNFGASDCKCRTHLHYFAELPETRPQL